MKHDEGQGALCRGTSLCRPDRLIHTSIHKPVNRDLVGVR